MAKQYIAIRRGDTFATTNPMALGKAINGIQWIQSADGQSRYTHAGLILNRYGMTFEAGLYDRKFGKLGWHEIKTGIFERYVGEPVIISRYENLDPHTIEKAINATRTRFEGKMYPYLRLLVFLIPYVVKWVPGKGVCSEVVAYYEWQAGIRNRQWRGTTPDRLADNWHRWQGRVTVGEGILGMDEVGCFVD